MAYTPPLYDAVNFNATKAIVIPPFDAVNFNISSVYDIEINIKKSILILGTKPFYFTEAAIVRPAFSILQLYSTQQRINPIVTIAVPISVLHPYVKPVKVDNLPDIIIKPSILIPRSNIVMVNGGDASSLPSKISGGIPIGWEKSIFTEKAWQVKWENTTTADNNIIGKSEGFPHIDNSVEDNWNVLEILDHHTKVNHNNPLYFRDLLTQSLWNSLIIVDGHTTIKYGFFTEFNNSITVSYLIPGPKDTSKKVSYEGLQPHTLDFVAAWNAPGASDCHKLVPWGPISYFKFCLTKYYPPVPGAVNFGIKGSDFTVIDSVFYVEGLNSDPRCPFDHHTTGPRDPYEPPGVIKPIIYPPVEKDAYYMLNTVTVKRLPDNVPIEVTSITIKYDKDSWLWQFTLTISGKDKNQYLDLIKPDSSNANLFTDIEIMINGWKWTCRVESYTESRVFAKDAWTVTGRSPSMELGYPQNPKSSFVYDAGGTAPTAGGQIIDDIIDGVMLGLPDKGWTVDWSAYADIHTGFDPFSADSWGIPPGVFSWTDKTQIEAIKQLTDSIGAFIMTSPDCVTDKKLYVKPKYDFPPWHWNTVTAFQPIVSQAINAAVAVDIGRTYESLSTYTSVFVMGQNSTEAQKTNIDSGFVIVEVFRDGFASSDRVYGSDIVDPYMYNWQAAVERGRGFISETGEWLKHTLRLMSLEYPTELTPKLAKLVVPGDFIQVVEKSKNWYSSADSTMITASVLEGSAFVVHQTIETREYIGT